MGHLRAKVDECKYRESDRKLKEQFIYVINDNDMMTKIIRDLPVIKKMNKRTTK